MNRPNAPADQLVDANTAQISFISADSAAVNSVFGYFDISEIGVSDTVFENTNSFISSPPKDAETKPAPPTKPNGGHTSTPRKSIPERKHARFNLSSDGIAVCRICHSSEASCPFSNGEPLISPCHCRGSTGLYHRTCLERWLSAANKDKCEICKFQYHIERQPKRLTEFLVSPGSKTIRRHIISDLICWLILTPTASIGAWLCISGAVGRANVQPKMDTFDRIQVPTLIGLAAFLVLTYLVWSIICLRYHLKIWRRWRRRNYRIRVLDAEEAKRKRSVASAISDINNNEGYQLRTNMTPSEHASVHVISGGGSAEPAVSLVTGGSSGTRYSSPWGRVSIRSQVQSTAPQTNSPIYYSTGGWSPPGAPLASLQEIIL